jgi:hypothetical protein
METFFGVFIVLHLDMHILGNINILTCIALFVLTALLCILQYWHSVLVKILDHVLSVL